MSSLVNPSLGFTEWVVCDDGSSDGTLGGILECVRLSARRCLDKAPCPLSPMAQLGRGMPAAPEIEGQLKPAMHAEAEGRVGPGWGAGWGWCGGGPTDPHRN